MEKLKVEYIDTGELKPYENNAKIHTDAQIEQIARSIQEFGMNDPIAVWKDNEIIEGHGRLLACQLLGIKEVPIIRLDGLTDEQRRAYMNVHNQLTMNTGFDIDLLAEELGRIEDIDMSLFGFDVDDLIEEQEIDEENAEAENATDSLPESKVYICAVSAFGTNSEGIVIEPLKQETADKVLKYLQEIGGGFHSRKAGGGAQCSLMKQSASRPLGSITTNCSKIN